MVPRRPGLISDIESMPEPLAKVMTQLTNINSLLKIELIYHPVDEN